MNVNKKPVPLRFHTFWETSNMRCIALIALVVTAVLCHSIAAVRASGKDDIDFTFVSMGDWGLATNDLGNLKTSIREKVVTYGSQHILALGDNFYPMGVNNVEDHHWESVYKRGFRDLPEFENVTFLPIAGNHDWYSNVSAQVAYSKLDPNWHFPSLYYTYTAEYNRKKDGKPMTIQFVMMDTDTLFFHGDGDTYDQNAIDKNGDFTGLPYVRDRMLTHVYGRASSPKQEEQWAFINSTLLSSTADWLIVCGHNPLYSGGRTHFSSFDLHTLLRPTMDEVGVSLYLSGHDHNLQHLKPHNSNLHAIVSGAGSRTAEYYETPLTQFGDRGPGYTFHVITGDVLTTTFYSNLGDELYSFSTKRMRKV